MQEYYSPPASREANPSSSDFSADRPVLSSSEDMLGFTSVAERLATSILSQSAKDGLVISLEGKWGSGKSSILNLLAANLNKPTSGDANPPHVINFAPWIVSDRDAMLVQLMADISSAIETVSSQSGAAKAEKAKRTANKLRGYTSKITKGLAPIAGIAGLAGVPWAGVAKDVLENTGEFLDKVEWKKSVSELKADLVADLQELQTRIIVIIDDLDRLEPPEIAEVMRLTRAVADFPNIIYILSFDPDILATSLKVALRIEDGAAYLRKIVQVSVKVPQPEPFDLRNWLVNECLSLHQSVASGALSSDAMERLHLVCQIEGSRLKTPRDVVRVLNLAKLHWPPVADKVDYADLVWLQIVKAQDKLFYDFVERYIAEFSAVAAGAYLADSERSQFSSEFAAFITDDVLAPRSVFTLQTFLPGLKSHKEPDKRLFNISDAEVASFVHDRRLASPEHSRYFFAFSKPAGALADTDYNNLLAAAAEGKNLEEAFKGLVYQRRPQGGLLLSVIIDRLTHTKQSRFSPKAIPSLVMLMADSMDEAGRLLGRWGNIPIWSDGYRLLAELLPALKAPARKRTLSDLFQRGKAMGWLMSKVLRREIFSHGRFGDQKRSEKEWLLTDAELDTAIKFWIKRARTTDKNYIVESPDLMSVFFGWQQSGNESSLQHWIGEQSNTDSEFLKMLNGCRSWMHSDKTYYPLKKSELEVFIDYETAMKRLEKISKDDRSSPADQALALELLEAARIGKD